MREDQFWRPACKKRLQETEVEKREVDTYTDHKRPIAGRDLLRITSGIYQTIEGDLKAFD